VRLVDREQRDARTREEIEAARRQQPLGRHVQEIQLARDERALDRVGRARVEVELRNAARTPSCVNAATWSCISAISGDTTMPCPRAGARS